MFIWTTFCKWQLCFSYMEKQALTRCFTVLLVIEEHVAIVDIV